MRKFDEILKQKMSLYETALPAPVVDPNKPKAKPGEIQQTGVAPTLPQAGIKQDPTKPAVDPTKPAVDPTKPAVDPTKQAETATSPTTPATPEMMVQAFQALGDDTQRAQMLKNPKVREALQGIMAQLKGM